MDAWALVVGAGVIAGYACVSRRLENTPITAAIVFVTAGFALGTEGLGWLHLSLNEHGVSVLAEATLVVVLFTDASRIDLRALRRRVRGAGATALDRPAADDHRGRRGRCVGPARRHFCGGCGTRDRARADGRGVGPGRGDGCAPALAYSPGSQRGKRPQRRAVRATPRDHARRRRRRFRPADRSARDANSWSKRSAGACSVESLPE